MVRIFLFQSEYLTHVQLWQVSCSIYSCQSSGFVISARQILVVKNTILIDTLNHHLNHIVLLPDMDLL